MQTFLKLTKISWIVIANLSKYIQAAKISNLNSQNNTPALHNEQKNATREYIISQNNTPALHKCIIHFQRSNQISLNSKL